MHTRFTSLTPAQLLALTSDDFNLAVRLEALERGIRPPVPLSEALKKSEWRGFRAPADFVEVWSVAILSGYGTSRETGIAYLDKAQAEAALVGMVRLEESRTSRGDKFMKICDAHPTIVCVRVPGRAEIVRPVGIEEYYQDDTDFLSLVEECRAAWNDALQKDYDRKVALERKAEYLRLAGGDAGVAERFWNKVEKTPWPAE